MNRDVFNYRPLAEGDIRLINLQQGSWDEHIEIELIETSLGSGPQKYFEALSYTWGDQNSATTISCNGRSIRITNNLAQALRRLRFRERNRYLILYIYSGIESSTIAHVQSRENR
jgi:hypothetical protein